MGRALCVLPFGCFWLKERTDWLFGLGIAIFPERRKLFDDIGIPTFTVQGGIFGSPYPGLAQGV